MRALKRLKTTPKNPLMSLSDIHKSFGSTHALRGANLEINGGEILVLMGANGAGKSMLVKLIGGVYQLDKGEMLLNECLYQPRIPQDALKASIVTVHQHVGDTVILDMSIAENLALDSWCLGEGDWFFKRDMKVSEEFTEQLGLKLDFKQKMQDLSLANRQLVAIARALSGRPRLLILDEPTASLSQVESDRLFKVLEDLREKGCAILYISHNLSEIERLADRVAVLREGQVVEVLRSPVDYVQAVETMLGYSVKKSLPKISKAGEPVLQVQELKLRETSKPMNFSVHRGEVLAVTGLIGSGKTELAEILFGQRQAFGGSFLLNGQPFEARSAAEAIAKGVFMTPEDRGQALVNGFRLFENLVLPFTGFFSRWGWLQKRKECALSQAQVSQLKIVCSSVEAPIENLSGGNQQKVVLGRWFCQPCQLLILDEPFLGIDIGARQDILQRLRATASERATLVFCSDPDEAIEIADRMLVFHVGNLNGEHSVRKINRKQMIKQMLYACR